MDAADDLVLDALGERHRRAILRLLPHRPPAGNERIYEIHAQGIGALKAYVDEVWGEAIARFRLLADNSPVAGESARQR